MNKWKILIMIFTHIFSFFLGGYLGHLKEQKNKIVTERVVETIKYIHSDPVEIIKYLPKPYKVETIIYDTIYPDIDTLEVVKDYFTRKYYDQVFVDDSISGFIRLEQSVFMNMIEEQKLTILPPPRKEITREITREILIIPKHKMTPFISVDYSWKGKDNDLTLGVGLDVTRNFGFQVGYSLQGYKGLGLTYTF